MVIGGLPLLAGLPSQRSKTFESGIIINGKFPSKCDHWMVNILPKGF